MPGGAPVIERTPRIAIGGPATARDRLIEAVAARIREPRALPPCRTCGMPMPCEAHPC